MQAGLGPSLRGVGALAADFYLSTGYMPLKRDGMQPRRSRLLLGPQQIAALIAYVASLGNGPAVPTSASRTAATCPRAAPLRAALRGLPPDRRSRRLRHRRSPAAAAATRRPTQIAEAVRIGPYVMPKFSQQRDLERAARLAHPVRAVDTKHPDDRGGWSIGHVGPIPEGLVTWFFGMTVLVACCMLIGKRLRRG